MKQKIFTLIGVRIFKLLIVKLGKKLKRENYFLDSYHLNSLLTLKKTIRVNQLVHLVALFANLLISVITLKQGNMFGLVLNILLFLLNLYLCLLQEYHISRLNPLIDKKEKKRAINK